MAETNRVVQSINMNGDTVCVDVFRRPDGTYGFDEYRRDPEDGRGWFSVGYYGSRVFESAEAALQAARGTVAWLEDRLG